MSIEINNLMFWLFLFFTHPPPLRKQQLNPNNQRNLAFFFILQKTQYGVVEGDFALAISLYHGYELVHLHGLRSLYNFLDGIINGNKGYGRTRTELMKLPDFCDLMNLLQEKFGNM
jgi:hypothetical protein